MKRFLLLLVALLFVLAACGDDDDTISTNDPSTTDSGDLPVNDGDTPPPGDPIAEPGDSDTDPGDPQPLPDGPLGAGPYPIADLAISYEHPDVGVIDYQIVCLGDTATLIGDVADVGDQTACLSLADPEVQMRLVEGPPANQACTEIWGGPETARITGTLDDQPVDTTVDRANGCGISDWDQVLGALLPAPRPFD